MFLVPYVFCLFMVIVSRISGSYVVRLLVSGGSSGGVASWLLRSFAALGGIWAGLTTSVGF